MPIQSVKTLNFTDSMFVQNSRLILPTGCDVCWIVDPGLPPATQNMLKYMSAEHLTPIATILTHAHADHIAGIPLILGSYPELPVYLAENEWPFLGDPSQNLSATTGLDLRVQVPVLKDLPAGGSLELGQTSWRVLDTSGHSPGGRTLSCARAGVAIVGDALFAGSIGRIDFPHSDGQLLLTNIRENLFTLPGETLVLSGHGPDTSIGVERRTNPFFEH